MWPQTYDCYYLDRDVQATSAKVVLDAVASGKGSWWGVAHKCDTCGHFIHDFAGEDTVHLGRDEKVYLKDKLGREFPATVSRLTGKISCRKCLGPTNQAPDEPDGIADA